MHTFLNFPSMKLFDILQKLGSEPEIASDMPFTKSRIACHVGSPGDFATPVNSSTSTSFPGRE